MIITNYRHIKSKQNHHRYLVFNIHLAKLQKEKSHPTIHFI